MTIGSRPDPWLPTPLELTCGITAGPSPLFDGEPSTRFPTARAALEAAVLPALLRAPCLVSFSGGCDSSLVLSVATHVARREGLPLPVPFTHLFPGVASSHESSFQDLVLARAGLTEREQHSWTGGELEIVGPVAQRFVAAVGVRLPFNAHFHEPVFAAAAGGSVLTGIGGDQVLDVGTRVDGARLLRGRLPPPGHRRPSVKALLPARSRKARSLAERRFEPFVWVRPHARARLEDAYASWETGEPLSQGRSLQRYVRSRQIQLGRAARTALGAHHDVLSVDPLLDVGFVDARATELGFAGGTTRPGTLRHLAGDLLPVEILDRRSKASFNGAFYGDVCRAFTRQWDGTGVDDELVDADALRDAWRAARPDARTFCLMQQVMAHQAR